MFLGKKTTAIKWLILFEHEDRRLMRKHNIQQPEVSETE